MKALLLLLLLLVLLFPFLAIEGQSARRPTLLFDHLPKAGGTSVKAYLNKLIGTHVDGKQVAARTGHNESLSPDKWVLVHEFESLTEAQRERFFTIGLVREPCSYYLSLWAFGSDGKGSERQKLGIRRQNRRIYGQRRPYLSLPQRPPALYEVAKTRKGAHDETLRTLVRQRLKRQSRLLDPHFEPRDNVSTLHCRLSSCRRLGETRGECEESERSRRRAQSQPPSGVLGLLQQQAKSYSRGGRCRDLRGLPRACFRVLWWHGLSLDLIEVFLSLSISSKIRLFRKAILGRIDSFYLQPSQENLYIIFNRSVYFET